jgi:hypothetical protein
MDNPDRYERVLYQEVLIAKYVRWFLWLASAFSVIWFFAGPRVLGMTVSLWVPFGLWVAADCAAYAERAALKKMLASHDDKGNAVPAHAPAGAGSSSSVPQVSTD